MGPERELESQPFIVPLSTCKGGLRISAANDDVKNLAILVRANFLLLTLVIVAAGLSAAFYDGHVLNVTNALLTLLGALLAHMAVNTFNNYFDYKTGVDRRTLKTPFSGGIHLLVDGRVSSATAFSVGLLCFMGAAVIGLYFIRVFFWPLLPILVYGGISICFYTPWMARLPGVSEIVAGTNFGLMALGAYVTQTGEISSVALAVFLPSSILVAILLLLNEFPDVEADRLAGRRHLVLLLGRKRASRLYVALLALVYLSIISLVFLGVTPMSTMLTLATLPFALKAAHTTMKRHDDVNTIVSALGSNTVVVLATIALIAVGLVVGALS